MDAAAAWLERMIAAGIEPNAVSFNPIIQACAQMGQADEAERWCLMSQPCLDLALAGFIAYIRNPIAPCASL